MIKSLRKCNELSVSVRLDINFNTVEQVVDESQFLREFILVVLSSFVLGFQVSSGIGWTCPDTVSQPNSGLVEETGEGGCPNGMTKIGDFCIDKYEASVIKSDGTPWSPYCDPQFGNVEVKAVSIKNGISAITSVNNDNIRIPRFIISIFCKCFLYKS